MPPKSSKSVRPPSVDEKEWEKSTDTQEAPIDEGDDNDLAFPADSLSSRLQSEFLVLKLLGKGGFGEVIKVGTDNSI